MNTWCFWCEYHRAELGEAPLRLLGQVVADCPEHVGAAATVDLLRARALPEDKDALRDRLLSLLEDHVTQLVRQGVSFASPRLRKPTRLFVRN